MSPTALQLLDPQTVKHWLKTRNRVKHRYHKEKELQNLSEKLINYNNLGGSISMYLRHIMYKYQIVLEENAMSIENYR